MVKQRFGKHWVFVGIALGAALSGCTNQQMLLPGPSPRTSADEPPLKLERSAHPLTPTRLWSKPMGGLVTDLNVSADGSTVLASTAPDPDIPGMSGYWLSKWSKEGKLFWRKKLTAPVKSQSISPDGKLVVAMIYDEALTAFGDRGKILWTAEAACKPIIFSRAQRILCYHDDDAAPNVAFDLFDWNGKRLSSFPITHDILSLKAAPDQKHVVFALTRGEIVLLGADFKTTWRKKIDGEIVDVDVTSGDHPEIYAVTDKHEWVVLNEKGELVSRHPLPHRVDQLTTLPGILGVLGYGNGTDGQFVGLFSKRELVWGLHDRLNAEFSSNWISNPEQLVVNLDQPIGIARQGHLTGLDGEGKARWQIPVITNGGVYVFSAGARTVAIGTDDDTLNIYHLN